MNFKIVPLGILSTLVVLGAYFFFRPEQVTNYPSQGTDIVAFGDSLVQGIGATPGHDFVSLLSAKIDQPVVNLGRAGDTTGSGLARIKEIDERNPKVVLLLLGGNDYLNKVPVADTRKNLAAIIEHIHARGAVVVLLGVRGGLLLDHFDTEFENLRDTYHTAYVSDVLDGLVGNSAYMSDTVHPNDRGYEKIAERVYPILAEVMK